MQVGVGLGQRYETSRSPAGDETKTQRRSGLQALLATWQIGSRKPFKTPETVHEYEHCPRQAVKPCSGDDALGQPWGGGAVGCTSRHGHILFTSGAHGCYQVSKPMSAVRQEVLRIRETAHAGPDNWHPRPCIITACSRGPLDVIAISSSGSSRHRSTCVRACCRSRAS